MKHKIEIILKSIAFTLLLCCNAFSYETKIMSCENTYKNALLTVQQEHDNVIKNGFSVTESLQEKIDYLKIDSHESTVLYEYGRNSISITDLRLTDNGTLQWPNYSFSCRREIVKNICKGGYLIEGEDWSATIAQCKGLDFTEKTKKYSDNHVTKKDNSKYTIYLKDGRNFFVENFKKNNEIIEFTIDGNSYSFNNEIVDKILEK